MSTNGEPPNRAPGGDQSADAHETEASEWQRAILAASLGVALGTLLAEMARRARK
jgi:hypothetical protein